MPRNPMSVRSRFLIGLLIFLLLFMPYSTFVLQAVRHYLEVAGVGLGSIATMVSVGWKELILAVLGISAVGYTVLWRRVPFRLHWPDWAIIAFMAYGIVVGSLIVNDVKPVVFGIRYDFAVFLFYFIARYFAFDRQSLERLLKLLVVAAVPMLGFAILQVSVLPYNFLERFGYSWGMRVTGNPLPPYHFIQDHLMRAMATFPGPNSLAMYVVFLLLIMVFFGRNWMSKAWWGVACTGIFMVLILTYSRGHLASLVGALIVWSLMRVSWVRSTVGRMQAIVIGSFILFLAGFLYISVAGFSSTSSTSGIQSIIFHNTSSEVHRNVRMDAWNSIKSHPFGTGLGTSGLATTNTGGTVFNPESWYVQITQEFGWPGLLLALSVIVTLLFWMVRIYHTFPDPRDQRTVQYFIVSFVAIALAAQFLPCWFEVGSISWWILFGLFVSDYERSFGLSSTRIVSSKPKLRAEIE